jgi:uncharacterized protein (TIGR03086 family)
MATRFRAVAARFTETLDAVPPDKWESPAPCEGWVARDVVRHLVEWVPGFFAAFGGLAFPAGPSPDDDPAGAWAVLRDHLQALLDDDAAATRLIESPTGPAPLADVIGAFVMGDVLVHTWDLARAAGLDESLDADEVHGMYEGMLPMDAALRASGHFGPRVEVPEDADEQTKLLAFTGRQP